MARMPSDKASLADCVNAATWPVGWEVKLSLPSNGFLLRRLMA
jgi:hypothetical protein